MTKLKATVSAAAAALMLVLGLGCTTTSLNPAAPTTTARYRLNELPIEVTSTSDGRVRVALPSCSALSPESVVVFDKPSTPITDVDQLLSTPPPYWGVERDATTPGAELSEVIIGDTPPGFRETTALAALPQDQPLVVWVSWAGSAGPGVAATFSGQEFIVEGTTIITMPSTNPTPPGYDRPTECSELHRASD